MEPHELLEMFPPTPDGIYSLCGRCNGEGFLVNDMGDGIRPCPASCLNGFIPHDCQNEDNR